MADQMRARPDPAHQTVPVVRTRGLSKTFTKRAGLLARPLHIHAVSEVDLEVGPGETLGVVGESGCGKSTLGRLILRLIEPSSGAITFNGRDITHLDDSALRPIRRQMQVIFQDPFAALNPRLTIRQALEEPMLIHGLPGAEERLHDLLGLVGLNANMLEKRPQAMSGGQLQRVVIARALMLAPSFLVADEATASLDVSIQGQVLNLLLDIQRRLGVSYLFISHNFEAVRHVSDRIAVMYLGRVVELARGADLHTAPKHPYTRALLSAVLPPDPREARGGRRILLQGEPPDPARIPAGCPFHPRCWLAEDRCRRERPQLRQKGPAGHQVACHLVPEEAAWPGDPMPLASGASPLYTPGGRSDP